MRDSLPKSLQEIADVIGAEKALHLAKNWRKHYSGSENKKAYRTYIYIPQRVRMEHPLVQILGFEDAEKMVRHFGGEGLMVASCSGNKGGRPKKNPVVDSEDSEAQNPDVIHNGVSTMQKTTHGAACV